MAVVLNSEENSYFSSGSLRRSHSQPKFITTPDVYSKSPCRSLSSSSFLRLIAETVSASSLPSSSSRLLDSYSSYSTGRSGVESPNSSCVTDEDDSITFPTYDVVYYERSSNDFAPPLSPHIEGSYAASPSLSLATISPSTTISRPQSPDIVEHAEDDTAIRIQPSRHVDYLSHNWREEDLWSSWKHVVSRRKSYNNASRLENASWRSWVKAKYKLKTVSPETLNWLKDCDVTWLYGPLQSPIEPLCHAQSTPSSSCNRLTQNSSFLNKKPILKKRSMSELMLQQSLSTSSLLKQAAAAVQAQQSETIPEYSQNKSVSSSICLHALSTRHPSDLHAGNLSSQSSSDLPSPIYGDKKRIHFNEQVAQCIAVDVKGDDDDEPVIPDYADSDSDDGIMMKLSTTKRKYPLLRHKPKARPNSNQESNKIIAMLPSTTLKYQSDTPDPLLEMGEDECDDEFWDEDGGMLSLSESQETLRPSKPSMKISMGEEDDDDDIDWQPLCAFPNRKDSVVVAHERMKNPGTSLLSRDTIQDNNDQQVELRRTSSGMFIPNEDEENVTSDGLFGKVVETVNTAKDIAHVIWNVGWRR